MLAIDLDLLDPTESMAIYTQSSVGVEVGTYIGLTRDNIEKVSEVTGRSIEELTRILERFTSGGFSRVVVPIMIKQKGFEERSTLMSKIDENTSDGFHTFKELYEFRLLYNAALFSEWAQHGLYDVHKSWRHHDGEYPFGGDWFVVMAQLPTGQISNHYPAKDWDLFKVPTRGKAAVWDGHTAKDVAKRLAQFIGGYYYA
jgi:hypothetical protein